jgi:hypothetical protein
MASMVELVNPRARVIGTAVSALVFVLSVAFLLFTLTR